MKNIKIFWKIILIFICIIWITAVCVFTWSKFIEPRLLRINRQILYVPDANRQLNGLKIAVLSDLHIGTIYIDEKKIEKIISLTNLENPDIIFILGDLDSRSIAYSYKNKSHIINQFKKLSSKYGTYAIYGNHDFIPANIVEPILQKSKIPLIVDNFVKISDKTREFYVVGLNDKWGNNSQKSIDNVISEIPEKSAVILLVHNPDVFPLVPQRVNLTLSGHNHGGQIYLPLLGGLFVPSKYNQRYIKGHIAENGKHLYVSSGIGNMAPVRFGNIPEINILTLRSQDKKHLIINTKPKKGVNNLMTLYPRIKSSKFYTEWLYIFL